MRKIVIAADSFKGSLESIEVAASVKAGILKVFPRCAVKETYIADGGEGTVEAITDTTGGIYITAEVNNPLMRPVKAKYGITDNGLTAIIEMAKASGLTLIDPEERNPMKTTTYGTGELIKDALKRGCRNFLIGIGGSATNDAGTGMLQALGYRFYDADGNKLGYGGEILSRIEKIDDSHTVTGLKDSSFTIACDVTNPFSGLNGAAYIFGPQKGANPEMVEKLDQGLKHFADVIKRFNGSDINELPGAGAAGGLGGGFKAFLGASLISGIEMVLDAIKFDNIITDADLIITGEGKLDGQTTMGKAPMGILNAATKYNIPVIAICGAVEESQKLNDVGFTGVFPILAALVSLEQAMEKSTAKANIERTVIQIMRTIKNTNKRY